ncbi:MAG: PTS system mannose/fructose/sorbose family transporter subunit IID [Erysipelotrichaceae bacterium]|jgi:mannose/fructose/N-acetylgalactosamine-specific phosphotransferase system component IID|nr:PTS system mannose/fructose/sorbose family transporter subunit IID [Erysipelotrichaceae bacterium]
MAKTNKKLSKKALASACARHNWALQWCWNYERMQAAGYAFAMVPVIKELYSENEEQCRELERHMQFYNTHPGASALVIGADVALEEGYQPEVGDSLKVALMGPLAGIGDTVQAVLVTPPFSIMAAGMAAEGNWLSLVVLSLPLLALFLVRWPLFYYGYKKGADVISDVSGTGALDRLQAAASVLGMTVVGGFVPSILAGLKLSSKAAFVQKDDFGEIISTTTIQSGLDSILPYLIPVVATAAVYTMIKKFKVSPLWAIVIVAVIGFILGASGYM